MGLRRQTRDSGRPGKSYRRLVVSAFGRFVPLSDLLEETEISEKGPHASFDLVPERAEFLQ